MSERALKLVCERLQWNEATPSAYVLSWVETLDQFAAEVLEELFKKICPYCAGPSEYVELHDGKYHTKKGVHPGYENVKCYAANLRELIAQAQKGT